MPDCGCAHPENEEEKEGAAPRTLAIGLGSKDESESDGNAIELNEGIGSRKDVEQSEESHFSACASGYVGVAREPELVDGYEAI